MRSSIICFERHTSFWHVFWYRSPFSHYLPRTVNFIIGAWKVFVPLRPVSAKRGLFAWDILNAPIMVVYSLTLEKIPRDVTECTYRRTPRFATFKRVRPTLSQYIPINRMVFCFTHRGTMDSAVSSKTPAGREAKTRAPKKDIQHFCAKHISV